MTDCESIVIIIVLLSDTDGSDDIVLTGDNRETRQSIMFPTLLLHYVSKLGSLLYGRRRGRFLFLKHRITFHIFVLMRQLACTRTRTRKRISSHDRMRTFLRHMPPSSATAALRLFGPVCVHNQ